MIACLVLLISGWRPQEPDTRTGRWTAERLEKAEQLVAPAPNLLEQFLIWMETSIDEGWLGRELAGVKVYDWLLWTAVAALCVACLRGMWRLVGRYRGKKHLPLTGPPPSTAL